MSFSVRRVEDPAIYVRRNKPDILGLSSAWDNVADFKHALNRLEDNINAADKWQKPYKNNKNGPVLREISSETQHLGKVTRFQLYGEDTNFKSQPKDTNYKSQPKYSSSAVEIKTRRNVVPSKIIPSDISSINRDTYSQLSQGVSSQKNYSPSHYTLGSSKIADALHEQRPSFFQTTTVNPVVLNETLPVNSSHNKESPSNTTVNSSVSSQQFSLSSSPTFHGKAVLAKNEAALQKIKEKVQKQKAMLSKYDKATNDFNGQHSLHDSKDQLPLSSEAVPNGEPVSNVPMKRKVASASSVPTYKGFSSVPQKARKSEKRIQKPQPTKPGNTVVSSIKPRPKPEAKPKKGKVIRIVGSRCPKEVISTTSWRDGQARVKKILASNKGQTSMVTSKAPEKTDTTYSVTSPVSDDFSEGRLSDEEEKHEENKPGGYKEKLQKSIHEKDEDKKVLDVISDNSSVENKDRFKDVLSTDAQSMLADLAQDDSGGESEKKDIVKRKRPKPNQKPVSEEKYPKEKSRHYDQSEVQKYMAHQLAERKKKQKQEKLLKKKQEEEKQRRLKDLYERQKKNFAQKEKRFDRTFTCGNELRIPGHESYQETNEEYTKALPSTSANESDKENTEISDFEQSMEHSVDQCTTDGDVTLTSRNDPEDEQQNEETRELPPGGGYSGINVGHSVDQVIQPSSSLSLDRRAQRLTALRETALALQTRLQSQALRLGGASEQIVSQPVPRIVAQSPEKETGFKGALPGVVNIRRQADENEKQLNRVKAATKIQAVYRGHTVRKRSGWNDGDTKSDEESVHSFPGHDYKDVVVSDETDVEDFVFKPLRPLYETDHPWDDGIQFKYRPERSRFEQKDAPVLSTPHFSVPSTKFEPKGDRFSVMNIFARRHPTVAIKEILDEQPGSETASLLDIGGQSRKSDDIEYEDDFTDDDIATSSLLTEGDLDKESAEESKVETYSDRFESEDDQPQEKDSTLKEDFQETSSGKTRSGRLPSALVEDGVDPEGKNGDIVPVMTSTMQPNYHPDTLVTPTDHRDTLRQLPDSSSSPSLSFSDDSEPIRRPVFVRTPDHVGGVHYSPGSLQRKLTAEINLFENVQDSVQQLNDIEKARAVALAQQETVALAQIIKAEKQDHQQEMYNLRLKAKEEVIQTAKNLEKTRQAAAMAAASAEEKLTEVHNEAMKTNVESSRKYMEQFSKMTSGMMANTTQQLADFCKNIAATTSASVLDFHKMNQPTKTLVERGTSISEGHVVSSDDRNKRDDHSRTSDGYSDQSKSWETSRSANSPHQQGGYTSDEFESDKSPTVVNDESDIKTEATRSASSVESILEDLPDKSASDDDTTVNEESANETPSILTEKSKKTDIGRESISSLDYSSQFEDSSRVPTDDDNDFPYLVPSKEHEMSFKRITDDSFDDDKGKEKPVRSTFESEDSFGKFTVDMIQEYMREEEVRTKHQAAILRLREKSLKEKTKAELQWLKQLKKQSCDKKSDDVMPALKKRERGIRMNHKAETEEINFLKAANKAASVQRRFMIYQQQEIRRLHQATVNIRHKLDGDVSRKRSRQPKTSSPFSKSTSRLSPQTTSKTKPLKTSLKSPDTSHPTEKISEDINGTQGTSHTSPESSFPSYSASKTETSGEPQGSAPAQGNTEPGPSTIVDMLSFVDMGGADSNKNEAQLLKFHKMLVERQKKLVKDESEVNSMLQKVTEMINNQRNVDTRSPHGKLSPEPNKSEANRTNKSEETKTVKSHSDSSIAEELSSEKTISDEIDNVSLKNEREYSSCTFESDSSPSRPTSTPQFSEQLGKVHETFSTQKKIETRSPPERDFSRSSGNEVEESLSEALDGSLVSETTSKKDLLEEGRADVHVDGGAERIADSGASEETLFDRKDLPSKISEILEVSEKSYTKPRSSPESSIAEDLDESRKTTPDVPEELLEPSYTSPRSNTKLSDSSRSIPEDLPSTQQRTPDVSDEVIHDSYTEPRTDTISRESSPSITEDLRSPSQRISDVSDNLVPRLYTESRTDTSIPGTPRSVIEDLPTSEKKIANSPDEVVAASYTEPRIDTNIPDTLRSITEELPSHREKSPDDVIPYSYTEPRTNTAVHDTSRSITEDLPSSQGKTSNVPDDNVVQDSYTEPRTDTSISEKSRSVIEDSPSFHEKTPQGPDELLEYSYTEPRTATSVHDRSEEVQDDVPEEEIEYSYSEPRSSSSPSERSVSFPEDQQAFGEKSVNVPEDVFEDSYTEAKSGVSVKSLADQEKQSSLTNVASQMSDVVKPIVEEDLGSRSEMSEISEHLSEVSIEEEHVSAKISEHSGKTQSLRESDLQPRSYSKLVTSNKETELDISERSGISGKDVIFEKDVSSKDEIFEQVDVSGKKDISEKVDIPEKGDISVKGDIPGRDAIDEKDAILGGNLAKRDFEAKNAREDKTLCSGSSVVEEIMSDYEEKDVSESTSNLEDKSEGLFFGDVDKGKKSETKEIEDGGSKHSDTFTRSSAVDESRSARSESQSLEELHGVPKETEGENKEVENEPKNTESYGDESISDEIPEIAHDSYVEKKTTSEPSEIEGRAKSRDTNVLDVITDAIYHEIMDDSLEFVRSAKTAKFSRPSEEKCTVVTVHEDGASGLATTTYDDTTRGLATTAPDDNTMSGATVEIDAITKDLLADAILQMMAIKRRKTKARDMKEDEVAPMSTKPTHVLSPGKSPTAISLTSVGPGFGAPDEEDAVVTNALLIAKSNRTFNDDAWKTMDDDIEDILGTSLDDDDDDEFLVNKTTHADIPSDDLEPSVEEYSPMFAVPHNVPEMTSIVNSALDILLVEKRKGMPLATCEASAQLLGGETENESESRSIRSYRRLIFDLTKEVLVDTVSQDELTTRPPWSKAKWKSGQKLSREFRRWKSDEVVRVEVLERVTNLIGLGAPRTTMQTLQRKTPVRGNKKDNVDAILIEELRDEEPQWTDYDDDEISVKFQVADSILAMLLDDTVRVFNAIEAKRNVPENVLVV